MFIEVNNGKEDIKRMIINTNIIENAYMDEETNETVLILSDNTRLFIEDSYEEIKAMLMHRQSVIKENENTDIEYLHLPTRAYNCLLRANIFTIEDLCEYRESEILRLKSSGRKTLLDIIQALEKKGLKLN